MATYRELVYMTLDELKIQSDDSYFEEEHVIFLINKYRPFLLKQRYSDVRNIIPDSNYQSIKLELQASPSPSSFLTPTINYMRSRVPIPTVMNLNGGRVITSLSGEGDYWGGEFTYVNKDRFKYVGTNRFLPNIVYGSINPDNYLYLKSGQTITTMSKIRLTSIFENPIDAFNTHNGYDSDPLDIECPLEANLIVPLIQLVAKELLPSIMRVSDDENNAKDDGPDNYNENSRSQSALQNSYNRQQAGA